MHVHVSFLTPFLVLFSWLIIGPLLRLAAIAGSKTAPGQALAFVAPGF